MSTKILISDTYFEHFHTVRVDENGDGVSSPPKGEYTHPHNHIIKYAEYESDHTHIVRNEIMYSKCNHEHRIIN
jgi:hypothetical protein